MARNNHKKVPVWLERTLQGLAYWIGYSEQYYREHDLTEGAIVSEVCKLIQANSQGTFKVECEVDYARLCAKKFHQE